MCGAHLRILTFFGSNFRTSSCRKCSRPWIRQDLLHTVPASISMPRKMSLACRERSESWWMKLIRVWQQTSSRDEYKTCFRSLRLLPASSPGIQQPSLADNLLTRRGSTLLWWKGIFAFFKICLFHNNDLCFRKVYTEKIPDLKQSPFALSASSFRQLWRNKILQSRHIFVLKPVTLSWCWYCCCTRSGDVTSWSVFKFKQTLKREQKKKKNKEK